MVQQVLVRGVSCDCDCLLMTSSDHNNDLVPAQEKLEWVTPKISLMEAENTKGKASIRVEPSAFCPGGTKNCGPS